MQDNKQVLDLVGQPIVAGSIIAYAVRDGNSGALRIARVRKIVRKENSRHPKLHIGLLTETSWGSGKPKIKNTYMVSPERAIVIDTASLSDGYKFLMSNVKVEEN